jgi:hypothetical protein
MKMLLRCCTVLVAVSLLALAGCATHDRRDTAYDPKIAQGQSLFDQMPNWERRCLHKGENRC